MTSHRVLRRGHLSWPWKEVTSCERPSAEVSSRETRLQCPGPGYCFSRCRSWSPTSGGAEKGPANGLRDCHACSQGESVCSKYSPGSKPGEGFRGGSFFQADIPSVPSSGLPEAHRFRVVGLAGRGAGWTANSNLGDSKIAFNAVQARHDLTGLSLEKLHLRMVGSL